MPIKALGLSGPAVNGSHDHILKHVVHQPVPSHAYAEPLGGMRDTPFVVERSFCVAYWRCEAPTICFDPNRYFRGTQIRCWRKRTITYTYPFLVARPIC